MAFVNSDRDLGNLAVELNRLCEARWPGGNRTANVELAAALSAHTGRALDRQFVWRVRTGRVSKVDASVAEGLCRIFGLEAGHFTRGDERGVSEALVAYAGVLSGVDLRKLSGETLTAGYELAGELFSTITVDQDAVVAPPPGQRKPQAPPSGE